MEVRNLNTVVTSREEILRACRRIVSSSGLGALNMRQVAQTCGVAVGSVYHYFPSKADLMTATVESVWQDVFHLEVSPALPLPEYVRWLFQRVQGRQYPDFFLAHSVNFASSAKSEAREIMTRCFSQIKAGLLQSLRDDPSVSPSAFTDAFSEEAFIDFVFSAFLTALVRQDADCGILEEMIRRAVYRP